MTDDDLNSGGTVVAIHIADQTGGPLRALDRADLRTGRGIAGDRNFSRPDLSPKREVTLIESEAVEQFNADSGLNLAPGEIRRNLVTKGVNLNDLVDHDFSVGPVRLHGIELCEPCAYLAGLLDKAGRLGKVSKADFVRGMTHHAGLRARIISDGTVGIGDVVSPG